MRHTLKTETNTAPSNRKWNSCPYQHEYVRTSFFLRTCLPPRDFCADMYPLQQMCTLTGYIDPPSQSRGSQTSGAYTR